MKESILPGTEIKDSGRRRQFATGAVRDFAAGKGRYDLIPPRAERELAIHFEQGAVKYGDNNYLKGIKLSVYLDSLKRHAGKILMGMHDERHDRAAAWNAMAFLETAERIRENLLPAELDDVGWIVPLATPFVDKPGRLECMLLRILDWLKRRRKTR